MSDVGYDIVKWQKRWLWSIRVKIGLHKCQSEVGTQSDFFWWSGYPVRFFLVKWVPSVRFFWWSGYKVPIWQGEVGTRYPSDTGEVGTRWVSDSITSYAILGWKSTKCYFLKKSNDGVNDYYWKIWMVKFHVIILNFIFCTIFFPLI